MRVAFDETVLALDASGTAGAVRELGAALDARDDVELLRLAHRPPAFARGRLAVGLDRELRWMPAGLARTAARRGADLLHCPAALGPARRTAVPRVVTIHDVLALEHPSWFTRANALQQRLVVPGLVRHAAAVVTPSRHTATALARHVAVDPARVHVVPWGVAPRFSPGPADEALVARLGLRAPYVLTVATLQPRKNLGFALDAHAELARRGTPVQLVVAGGRGWDDAALAQRLAGAPDVVLTGRVTDDELVALMRGAACLVHPSVHEGFGFPPFEAMACGTPVVAADGGAVPELAGDAAWLVADGDVRGLADALAALTGGDDARAAALRGRGLARAGELTWERCAAGVRAAYAEALGERA